MFNFRRIALAVFLAVISISVMAQDTSARLSGTVSDPSGAVVPGASLTLVNVTTGGEIAHVVSDDHGSYSALQLPPGNYKLIVEAAGFRRTETPLQLFVASKIDLPITLQVGNAGETLIVTAQAEDLNRSDATVSTLISPNDVQNLPLPNREITNLIALAPGVVHGGADDSASAPHFARCAARLRCRGPRRDAAGKRWLHGCRRTPSGGAVPADPHAHGARPS